MKVKVEVDAIQFKSDTEIQTMITVLSNDTFKTKVNISIDGKTYCLDAEQLRQAVALSVAASGT